MQFGFTVLTAGDSVNFQFYGPSDDPAPIVTFAQDGPCCAALAGRLYYRDELLSNLDESARRREFPNDAAIALKAYARRGLKGVERLEGDFALIIWDGVKRSLIATRDPLGGFPLFWSTSAGQFAFGTAMRPLLKLFPECRLNREFLAEYITRPVLGIQETSSEDCAYDGIHRVLAGSIVELNTATGEITRRTQWNWLEKMVDPRTARLEEIAEQFDERFRPAIRERVRGTTASHLSGGMDSTAVALIARDWINAGVGQPPLHTLSFVFEQLTSLTGEKDYIDSALAGQDGISAHRIKADDLLTYDSFVNPPYHDEPYGGLLDLAKERALTDAAFAVGAKTILTGAAGDDVADVAPFHITDMLRHGHVLAAWREASRWARTYNTDQWGFLYRFGFANLLPLRLRAGLRSAGCRGRVDWAHQGDGTLSPWILDGFARSQCLYERGLENLGQLYGACRNLGQSMTLGAIQAQVGDCWRWALAAPLGIMRAHPFADPRILTLALGIRLRFRQQPGKQKPLLAHAMREVLPPKIIDRRGKGHFNEVYYRGLARNLTALESLVKTAPIDEFFDRDILLQCLRETAMGIERAPAASMRLDRSLSLVSWLAMQHRWQYEADTVGKTIRVSGSEAATAMEARL